MFVERGTRDNLEKFFDLNQPLNVTLQIQGSATYDFCCFGVDANEKLSDDRYMIFYNQLASPRKNIIGKEISSGMKFTVKLNALPKKINKLVFTCSIDGAGVMSEIFAHKILIGDKISAEFGGKDFQQEKAVTSLEIYRKNGGWRFNVVARGFNVGLEALVAFYGGETQETIHGTIDTLERFGLDRETVNKIRNETRNLEPARRQAFVSAISVLSDSRPFVDAAQRMAAYDTLCENLSQLNTMRGGVKGFKGFVGEHMQAANATANGQLTRVVNNNGPIDLIFKGKNGHTYPQQLKIGYKPRQIDFVKYKGQTVIVDKGNPYLQKLQAEGARHGVKVVEGNVTEAEAKWWADTMQLESKVTGKKTTYFVPKVNQTTNYLSAMHEAGKEVGKTGALYGAGFSIGKNIVGMMRGDVTAGEAAANVAIDTAVSYGTGYATGAIGSAVARTAAGRAVGSAVGSATSAVTGTAAYGAITSAVGSATSAVTGTAAYGAVASAVGSAGTAITSAGVAVGGALTTATAGTAIGGAVATGVAGAAAVGAAAVAAAPVLAVGAVIGGLFSLFFDD